MAKCKAPGCGKSFKKPNGDMRITWCSPDCGVALSAHRRAKDRDKALAREKKKAKDAAKANRKAVLDLNRRDRRWQHKQTQPVFNRMRRLEELLWFQERGIEPYCISCRNTHMDWACGHFITVAAAGRLRYDPRNTFLQCNMNCNSAKSGARGDYEEGLIFRFGDHEGQAIIDYCKSNTGPRVWDWLELENMRIEFAARSRELVKMVGNMV